MEIKPELNATITNAAVGLLAPYVDGLSAENLLAAIRCYSNSTITMVEPMILPAKPMTKAEVAKFLQISQPTVDRRIKEGKLRKIGLSAHAVRIDPNSVREYINASTQC